MLGRGQETKRMCATSASRCPVKLNQPHLVVGVRNETCISVPMLEMGVSFNRHQFGTRLQCFVVLMVMRLACCRDTHVDHLCYGVVSMIRKLVKR